LRCCGDPSPPPPPCRPPRVQQRRNRQTQAPNAVDLCARSCGGCFGSSAASKPQHPARPGNAAVPAPGLPPAPRSCCPLLAPCPWCMPDGTAARRAVLHAGRALRRAARRGRSPAQAQQAELRQARVRPGGFGPRSAMPLSVVRPAPSARQTRRALPKTLTRQAMCPHECAPTCPALLQRRDAQACTATSSCPLGRRRGRLRPQARANVGGFSSSSPLAGVCTLASALHSWPCWNQPCALASRLACFGRTRARSLRSCAGELERAARASGVFEETGVYAASVCAEYQPGWLLRCCLQRRHASRESVALRRRATIGPYPSFARAACPPPNPR
jgi:hypothetical protein